MSCFQLQAEQSLSLIYHYGASFPCRNYSDMKTRPRQELDREQAALLERRGRGLGLMKDQFYGVGNWYGGKIQQTALLQKSRDGMSFVIQLEKLENQYRSHRLGRHLSSRRILHVRFPKELLMKESAALREYFHAKFVICGRVFMPFRTRKNHVFMVETSENYHRKFDPSCGDDLRLSFQDFVQQHNPLELNKEQVCIRDFLCI